MRQVVVVLVIALGLMGMGPDASAQTRAAGSAARSLSRAIDAAITGEASMQMTRFPGPRRSARCCNWKGAAIGAGIGAGLAFGLTGSAEGGCSPYAWRAVGVLGGVGATIGLFM